MTQPSQPVHPIQGVQGFLGAGPARHDQPAWPGSIPVELSDAAGTPCVDVPAAVWADALEHAWRSGYRFLDWLSAVDEPSADPPSVDVLAHVAALRPLRRLLLRTRLPAAAPVVASATGVWAGAAWHERETHEMFGVDFSAFDDGTGAGLRPLLLPDGFEGTPLRKSFQLASRAVKAWPGAKEPGESGTERAAPARRKLLPPGVPDPLTWGPRDPDEGSAGA